MNTDGMRTDVAGNLYVSRNGIGTIIKLNTAGVIVTTVKSSTINGVSNLDMGGTDGRTLYFVGMMMMMMHLDV